MARPCQGFRSAWCPCASSLTASSLRNCDRMYTRYSCPLLQNDCGELDMLLVRGHRNLQSIHSLKWDHHIPFSRKDLSGYFSVCEATTGNPSRLRGMQSCIVLVAPDLRSCTLEHALHFESPRDAPILGAAHPGPRYYCLSTRNPVALGVWVALTLRYPRWKAPSCAASPFLDSCRPVDQAVSGHQTAVCLTRCHPRTSHMPLQYARRKFSSRSSITSPKYRHNS